MQVTIELPEALLKPLLEDHLVEGRSVKAQICDAIALLNKVRSCRKANPTFGNVAICGKTTNHREWQLLFQITQPSESDE